MGDSGGDRSTDISAELESKAPDRLSLFSAVITAQWGPVTSQLAVYWTHMLAITTPAH